MTLIHLCLIIELASLSAKPQLLRSDSILELKVGQSLYTPSSLEIYQLGWQHMMQVQNHLSIHRTDCKKHKPLE